MAEKCMKFRFFLPFFFHAIILEGDHMTYYSHLSFFIKIVTNK